VCAWYMEFLPALKKPVLMCRMRGAVLPRFITL
jgi:hypothetical protein